MSDDAKRKRLEDRQREFLEKQEIVHRTNTIIMVVLFTIAMMSNGIYMLFASGRINHIF